MELKEGIDIKIVYLDDTPTEYIDDVTHNDILDILEEPLAIYKIYDVSGSKKKLVWSDEGGFERAYESKKSVRKNIKESFDIKLMVNRIVDDLIGEYSSREWDSLSNNEKFDIIRIKYFTYEGKSKYLSEVRDLVIENMNHPFDIKFESKKSVKESINDTKRYKLQILNAMLDAMAEDENNIPKLGIYQVTPHINLDEDAIRTLIEYYK